MKLVFVNRFFHPDHSATSQILGDLAFHLAEDPRNEVVVVTSRMRYDDAAARLPATESIRGVSVQRVWSTRFGRGRLIGRALDYLSFYVAAAVRLWRECRRGDIVVAMTDPPLIGVVAGFVARLRGAVLVNWIQDGFPEVAEALGLRVPLAGALRALRNASMRAAAANVVLGQRMVDWARRQDVPDSRVAIIPNWADDATIRPLPHADNPLRREWGVAEAFVVAYSGNLGRAHDFATVLDAAEALRGDPDVAFLFIGGGHHRAAVEAAARTRGLGNVRWLPYQPRERLSESLGVADVHWLSLLPALEGLIVPSKIYGILAAGRPALFVGDPDGEVGRLVSRHQCGWVIAPGRGAEFAGCVRRLRDDPELRTTMGRRARAAFEAEGSLRRGLARWDQVLTPLAKGDFRAP